MIAGADLLTGIFNVTITALKLKIQNKSLLEYVSNEKAKFVKNDILLLQNLPYFQ